MWRSLLTVALLALPFSVAPSALAAPASMTERAASHPARVQTAATPAGGAILRMERGDARAKKTGKVSYRLHLPGEAKIFWIGQNASGQPASGSLTARQLSDRWTALGHQRRAGVLTTLTWYDARDTKIWAQALISNPRIVSGGHLVVDVRTSTTLPSVLRDYSVNVTRAMPRARSFPVTDLPLFIDAYAALYPTVTSASSVALRMTYLREDGSEVDCWNYTNQTKYPKYVFGTGSNDWVAFTPICGPYKFDATSFVEIVGATSTKPGQERASLGWRAADGGCKCTTDWVMTSWDINGNLLPPVNN